MTILTAGPCGTSVADDELIVRAISAAKYVVNAPDDQLSRVGADHPAVWSVCGQESFTGRAGLV
jgi:hypothetical protein